MFLATPNRTMDEIIYINLENVVMAQPRFAKVGLSGERKGKTYTSFLLTGLVGNSPTLETLLEWSEFVSAVAPFETAWNPQGG